MFLMCNPSKASDDCGIMCALNINDIFGLQTNPNLPESSPYAHNAESGRAMTVMALKAGLALGLIGVVWGLCLALYRLFWSPLAKFPGRRLAVSSMWYEFYHQVVKGGRYPWEIQKMHEEYGKNFMKSVQRRLLIVTRAHHSNQPA